MAFEILGAEALQALDWDGFCEYRSAFQAECDNDEADVAKLRSGAEALKAEAERRQARADARAAAQAAVLRGEGKHVASWQAPGYRRAQEVETEDPLDTAEYRSAFMDYINTGKRSDVLVRADASTLTTDVPVAIPTTLSNHVIEKLDDYGDIYKLVSKTNMQGGVEYGIDDFDFVTSWVGEEEVSEWQKAERKDKIMFGYHEFESRVQWSFLSGLVTMDNFNQKLAPKMDKSIAKFLDEAIIRGTGSGQMLGVVNDPRVTHVVEMTEAQFKDWKSWHSLFDAEIDPEYDDGNLLMAKTSWNKYIDTMADNNNAPVNYAYNPVSGKRTNLLVGKSTQLVKPSILPDFDKAAAGDVVAIYGDMSNYCVNWQPGGGISILRYPDYDKRKNKMLGYGVCDGKVVDPYGFILIKKKASA